MEPLDPYRLSLPQTLAPTGEDGIVGGMKKILSIIAVVALVGGVREYIKWANADTKEDAEKRLEQRYRELRKTAGGKQRRRNMAYEGDARAQFTLGLRAVRPNGSLYKISAQENEGLISKKQGNLYRARAGIPAWRGSTLLKPMDSRWPRRTKTSSKTKSPPPTFPRHRNFPKRCSKRIRSC